MTGSLQKKYDTYYVVLNLNDNGKRKQKWIPTGLPVNGNKRNAEKILRDTINEYENRAVSDAKRISFADYIRDWLEYKKPLVDEVTFQGYEFIATSRVLPYFDSIGIMLVDVSKKVLQKYFDTLVSDGRLDGKGSLSASSLKRIKNIINQPLNKAVEDELIPNNPCAFVKLPAVEPFESSYYNASQLKTLFSVIEDDPLKDLIKITALYGLRRSEVLGIKWDSIDFDTRRLSIVHTVSKVTKIVEKDKTKNKASRRSFVLSDEAIDIFKHLKDLESENRALFKNGYIDNDYVFKWPNGAPFSPDYVTSHFSKILKKNNLPHIRFHELRHSCASLLLNNGFTLKDVQEYMGHADIRMTTDIYGHLDTGRKSSLTLGIENCIF